MGLHSHFIEDMTTIISFYVNRANNEELTTLPKYHIYYTALLYCQALSTAPMSGLADRAAPYGNCVTNENKERTTENKERTKIKLIRTFQDQTNILFTVFSLTLINFGSSLYPKMLHIVLKNEKICHLKTVPRLLQ